MWANSQSEESRGFKCLSWRKHKSLLDRGPGLSAQNTRSGFKRKNGFSDR